MVKYAFGFLVVAMVSHIPAKSRMAVNYVKDPETLYIAMEYFEKGNFVSISVHRYHKK